MPDLIPAEFEVLDPRFAGTGGDRSVARLFSGGRWLEGPGYHPAGQFVLFSDIPNDRVLRYDEVSERTDVFLTPAGFSNGRTVDRQGRFVTCEHGERRVTRTQHDGSVKVLAASYQGHRLNSPQRCRRAFRRIDLVHRPELRYPHRLRGPRSIIGDQFTQCLSR